MHDKFRVLNNNENVTSSLEIYNLILNSICTFDEKIMDCDIKWLVK